MMSLRSRLGLLPPSHRLRLGHVVAGDGPEAEEAALAVLAPVHHATASGALRDRAVDPGAFARGEDPEDYDIVLVQQGAVPGGLADAFAAECRRRGVRLVVVLTDEAPADRLLASADAVLAGTRAQASLVAGIPAPLSVLPVALDPDVWTSLAVGADDGADLYGSGHDRPGLLHLGPLPSPAELDLLRAALDEVARRGHEVDLEIVGVADGPGYRGLPVPPEAAEPAARARWLQSLRRQWVIGVAPTLAPDAPADDLAFLEFSALGLLTIASELVAAPAAPGGAAEAPGAGALAEAAAHGAVLCPPEPQAWADAIVSALTDSDARIERVETARDHVRAERTEPGGPLWLAAVTGHTD